MKLYVKAYRIDKVFGNLGGDGSRWSLSNGKKAAILEYWLEDICDVISGIFVDVDYIENQKIYSIVISSNYSITEECNTREMDAASIISDKLNTIKPSLFQPWSDIFRSFRFSTVSKNIFKFHSRMNFGEVLNWAHSSMTSDEYAFLRYKGINDGISCLYLKSDEHATMFKLKFM